MKVLNLSRAEARNYNPDTPYFIKDATNCVWISIGEPVESYKRLDNKFLDEGQRLNIEFWDLGQPMEAWLPGDYVEMIHPPTQDEAAKIVDFLMENKNKNVVVNCAAGVSRSGAVAQFCCDLLGLEWGYGINRAVPNTLLYKLMRNHYMRFYNGVQEAPLETVKEKFCK